MQLIANKSKLISAIQIVQGAIASRAALPILSNVLLELKENTLKLTATNLDISISSTLEVESQIDGAVTVPAQKFYEIISSITDENINIEISEKNQIKIFTPKCKFKIMGISYEEFPRLPEFDQTEALKLDASILTEMLQLTAFAASTDETRYVLNGILCKINKNKLTMVATNGQKLALIEKVIISNQDKTIIIPIKTVAEIQSNIASNKEVSLIFAENQALFDFGRTQIISRLIEGEFPNYEGVIPMPIEQKVKIKRIDFLEAVKKAALLATPNYQATKFEFMQNKLIVSKVTPDIGDFVEEIEIGYSGVPVIIGFNPNYLIDVLKVLKDETIEFEIVASDKAGVIRTNGYIYIALPMQIE